MRWQDFEARKKAQPGFLIREFPITLVPG